MKTRISFFVSAVAALALMAACIIVYGRAAGRNAAGAPDHTLLP